MLRRLLLATTLAAGALTPAADAALVEVCVRQVTLTFSNDFRILTNVSGTVVREHTSTCVRVDSATGIPYTVQFRAVSTGTYTGNCAVIQISGEFSMTLVSGGTAGALYLAADPNYTVAEALVLVPDQVCTFNRLTGYETGPGVTL